MGKRENGWLLTGKTVHVIVVVNYVHATVCTQLQCEIACSNDGEHRFGTTVASDNTATVMETDIVGTLHTSTTAMTVVHAVTAVFLLFAHHCHSVVADLTVLYIEHHKISTAHLHTLKVCDTH